MNSPDGSLPTPKSKRPFFVLGAIAGDIIGSIFERSPIKSTNFEPLFDDQCFATDDTVLTVATMEALLNDHTYGVSRNKPFQYASTYQKYGCFYPHAGYGKSFQNWLKSRNSQPYNSFGNGSAMRASPIGWAFDDRRVVLEEAKKSAEVTHNHPEGIKGAQATALAVYLARMGKSKEEIKKDIEKSFGYDLSSRSIDSIRPSYKFDVSCQGSVPEAIMCFLESDSFEHAARLAVSLGGDSDTQACIACSIAEAYYGPLKPDMEDEVKRRLNPDLLLVVENFGKFASTRPWHL